MNPNEGQRNRKGTHNSNISFLSCVMNPGPHSQLHRSVRKDLLQPSCSINSTPRPHQKIWAYYIYWWCHHSLKENWDNKAKRYVEWVHGSVGGTDTKSRRCWWVSHQVKDDLASKMCFLSGKHNCYVALIGDEQWLFGIFDCWDHLMHNMTQNVHDKKHSRVPPSSRESQKDGIGNRWSYRVKLEQSKSHDSTVLDLSHGFIWTFFLLYFVFLLLISNTDGENLQESGTIHIITQTHTNTHRY